MNSGKKYNKAPKRVHGAYNNYKTSDRRMASGMRPTKYLHNQQTNIVDPNIEKIKTTRVKESDDNINTNTTAITRHDPKTGRIWHDSTLTEWDPSHYRLFVGNISNDVDETLLVNTFIKYPSLSKVKVPQDEKMSSNKGFAFISFADPEDYLKCYKEMNGKYVGSKPISLERAKTEIGVVVKLKGKTKKGRT